MRLAVRLTPASLARVGSRRRVRDAVSGRWLSARTRLHPLGGNEFSGGGPPDARLKAIITALVWPYGHNQVDGSDHSLSRMLNMSESRQPLRIRRVWRRRPSWVMPR